MSTTSIIVEHLLAGLLALAALLLFLLAAGADQLAASFPLERYSLLVSAFGMAVAYPLGVAVDEVSDLVFRWRSKKRPLPLKEGEVTSLFEVLAQHDAAFLPRYFDYIRGRQRMLRSAALTFPLLTLSGCLCLILRHPGWTGLQLGMILSPGLLLSVAFVVCTRRVAIIFEQRKLIALKQHAAVLARLPSKTT